MRPLFVLLLALVSSGAFASGEVTRYTGLREQALARACETQTSFSGALTAETILEDLIAWLHFREGFQAAAYRKDKDSFYLSIGFDDIGIVSLAFTREELECR